MKETTGNTNEMLFVCLSDEITGSSFTNRLNQGGCAFLQSARLALPTVLASFAVGVIFFLGISLFLFQLAEHGWR